MTELPFALPADFVRRIAFPTGRRLFALHWSPAGDELVAADDVRSACGQADERVYWEFVRRPEVRAWLDAAGVSLGNSEDEATHWLVVDTHANRAWVAPLAGGPAAGDLASDAGRVRVSHLRQSQ